MKYVYKISILLLVLALIPTVILAPMFTFVMSTPTEGGKSLAENMGIKTRSSFKDLYGYYEDNAEIINAILGSEEPESGGEEKITGWSKLESLIPSVTHLKTFNICLALALICGLVAAIFALFTKMKLPVILAGGGGLAATLIMNSAFNKFAAPLLSGVTSVSSIIGAYSNESEGLLGELLGGLGLSNLFGGLAERMVGKVTRLQLTTGYEIMLVVFTLIVIIGIVAALALRED